MPTASDDPFTTPARYTHLSPELTAQLNALPTIQRPRRRGRAPAVASSTSSSSLYNQQHCQTLPVASAPIYDTLPAHILRHLPVAATSVC